MRDYGTATWEGGDPACEHSQGRPGAGRADGRVDDRAQRNRDGAGALTSGACSRCGARRIDQAIGLEPTVDAYVARLVEVFREVRRVLRDNGTLWLNLGDSYIGANKGSDAGWDKSGLTKPVDGSIRAVQVAQRASLKKPGGHRTHQPGLKDKDLVGIPWRVAFAFQADGWWLRSDIIWSKPNPMPESVTDRPTKAHEYLFLLTKSARYFYDAEAIKEAGTNRPSGNGFARPQQISRGGRGRETQWEGAPTRNRRSVWTIATEPSSAEHYAAFPKKLVEPCILAGTSAKGCCAECGAPWERVVERETNWKERKADGATAGNIATSPDIYQNAVHGKGQSHDLGTKRIEFKGWRATCDHAAAVAPCVVMDPFMGSGTVALVAQRLGRRWLGCDLNPEYAEMARARCQEFTPVMSGLV